MAKMQPELQPPTRFIESFDSARFAPGEDSAERRIQAQLELMLSMLFGEPMLVPEPQSCDSKAFLEIADEVLDKLPRNTKNSPVRTPFLLSLRREHGYTSYGGMVSCRLAQPDFILSGWPEISEKPRERSALAKSIKTKRFDAARKSFPYLDERIGHVEQLDAYFRSVPHRWAGTSSVTLSEYVHRLAKLDASGPLGDSLKYLEDLPSALHTLDQDLGVV